jgi:hypothetical protein
MSTASTVSNINHQTLQYLPAVIASVQAVEMLAPTAPGADKFQAVMAGFGAGSQALAGSSPNATVAGLAELVNLSVLFANLLLPLFQHKKPPVAPIPGA